MQGLSHKLQDFMAEQGLTQSELARRARVSQSTVSRALSKRPARKGAAHKKLCIYAGLDGVSPPHPDEEARQTVLASFEKIWDRTPTHAAAIAQVIAALGGIHKINPHPGKQPSRKK